MDKINITLVMVLMELLNDMLQNNDKVAFQNLLTSNLYSFELFNIANYFCKKDNSDFCNIFLEALKKMIPNKIFHGLCPFTLNEKSLQCVIDHKFDVECYSKLFIIACERSNIKILEMLLNCGADINYNDSNAFVSVCTSGDVHICEFLLDNGLTIDYNNPNIVNGFKIIIKNQNLCIIEFLSNYGFDFSFLNDCSESKNTDAQNVTDILMAHGVNFSNIINLLCD
ncbi:putative ankyrin repeat protein [Cotonvirus japonicus]|uniref:Ankyrin repeat protein n=1 Tax=Cotonvirus japonicus TaxID=2811091 RepID=A0ABM7NQW6_9VIRU|nr:putative ankyrin repeat protein [Cotonvirus japonicus]BCS82507.1 putative ankyrin repeat protein [Cotonvirus japonicus]